METPHLDIEGQKVFFKTSEKMDEIDDGKISLIFTSPPYWNLKDYNHVNQIGQESYEKYLERMNVVWDECFRVSKDNAILAININSRRNKKVFYPIALDIYAKMHKWKLLDILIWYVPNALPQSHYYIDKLFDNKFEYILLFSKNYDYDYTFNKIRVLQKYINIDPRKDKFNQKGRCIGNIIRIPAYRPPNVKMRNYHVAAFPEELVYLYVSAFTNPEDYVLDPFLGSGTTLKVCRIMNRNGIGYEILDQFKDMIADRICEEWNPPDFNKIDIINSTSNTYNSVNPRRPKIVKKKRFIQKPLNNEILNQKSEVSKSKYDIILNNFLNSESSLSKVSVEGKKPSYIRNILKKRINKRKLNMITYVLKDILYIQKVRAP